MPTIGLRTSEKTDLISQAIEDIQAECPTVDKTATADQGSFKVKYAPHELVWHKVQPLTRKYGVSVVQGGHEGFNGSKWLTTRLTHSKSGQWIEGDVSNESAKAGMQGLGAIWSYARRIGLLGMLGIVPIGEDSDAADDYAGRAAKPPRVEKAARPVGIPPDAAAIVERVLAGLPSLTTMGGIDEAVKEIRGIVPKELDGRVRTAFKAARERVQSATREPGSDG